MSTWQIVLAVAQQLPAMHPAEIFNMREDVAIEILSAAGKRFRAALAATGGAGFASPVPHQWTDSKGNVHTRISSIADLKAIMRS